VLSRDGSTLDNPQNIGEAAHIKGENPGAARYDPNLPEGERNHYDNLIYLCGNCHTTIDGQPHTYSVEVLRKTKTDHEAWVRSSLAQEMTSVSFAELQVVTKAIVSAPSEPVSVFTITDPTQKMIRNQLTDNVRFHLTMGLGKAREVARFVDHVASLDSQFPERLKAGFVTEYSRLRSEGIEGDALFEALRVFASAGSRDFRQQAAGLAVLVYLFEKCEVFEP
jgi:hypothetical protein